uniref:SFRICE_035542 n=1 Tax=Spodoptera frugiperda TaxID=7108 RepID=A0A2H1VVW7_SPOFR
MRAPGCGGARPLRDSARAVLEWRATRTGHGYRVEDKSPPAGLPGPARPLPAYTHENLLYYLCPTYSYCTFYRSVDFL